jgi:hypothetical protein
VNVTDTPLTEFPYVSLTVACKLAPNAVLMLAVWGVPLVAVIEAGVEEVFVKEKLAGEATPDAEASIV